MAANKLDDALGVVLGMGNKPKRNNTAQGGGQRRANLQRANRVASKAPEVMVKISGGAAAGNHVREHVNYTTRNGKLVATNEQGQKVEGKDAVAAVAARWSAGDQGRGRGRATVNMVLSMPAGTNRDALERAASTFAARTFSGEREYLLVRHDDTKHPHCHLTLKAVGDDGRRLNPRKADLQAWRESFAECLREQGVTAEATPRRSRGVAKKGTRQAVLHASRAGRSRVVDAQQRAAKRDAAKATPAPDAPWEKAMKRTQGRVQQAWQDVAAELTRVLPDAAPLARHLATFGKGMAQAQTAQREREQAARAALNKDRGTDQARTR